MSNYYPYIISSLPMLHFGAAALVDMERVLSSCEHFIPEEDLETLRLLGETEEALRTSEQPLLKKWFSFDAALRNELVKIRATRKKIEPERFLRGEGFIEPWIMHAALNAYRATSLLEAEKMLDLERWRFLEELSFGHYFDFEYMLVYILKLTILKRWEGIQATDKPRIIEETLRLT